MSDTTDLVPVPASPPVLTAAELDSIERQAELLARSDIVPKQYQGRPADIIAAAFLGRDLAWSPMTSLRFVNVIDGVASISAEGLVALVHRAGHYLEADVSPQQVTASGRRADTGATMSVTFSLDDAAAAGLCEIRDGRPWSRSKHGRRLPWELYPKAMMWARAVSQLCRMLFADVTLGVAYVPEEISPRDLDPDETAEALAAARPDTVEVLATADEVATLVAAFDQVADDATRRDLKARFVREWGAPSDVTADRWPDAMAWTTAAVEAVTEPFEVETGPDVDVDADAVPDEAGMAPLFDEVDA